MIAPDGRFIRLLCWLVFFILPGRRSEVLYMGLFRYPDAGGYELGSADTDYGFVLYTAGMAVLFIACHSFVCNLFYRAVSCLFVRRFNYVMESDYRRMD